MINKIIIKIILGAFFLFQPMIVYLSSYVPGDCDDKAVHYFSAAYWLSKPENKEKLNDMLGQYWELHEDENGRARNVFRINSTWSYPLANMAISYFSGDNIFFADSVKNGLLTVSLLSIIVLAFISSATKFGFWQAVLAINLIAFYSLKVHFLVPEIPRNMHPFITYVPRGGLALLSMAPLLAYSDRKKLLLAFSLGLMFLWHLGMALMIVGLILLAIIITKLLTHFMRLFDSYYQRLFTTGAVLLILIRIFSVLIDFSKANVNRDIFSKFPFILEIPPRLSGVAYVILIVLLLSGLRIFVESGRGKLFELKGILDGVKSEVVIIGVLIFLTLNHLPNYLWVLKKQTGFFMPQCTEFKVIKLPENVSKLDLSNEPEFFLSLSKYLQ